MALNDRDQINVVQSVEILESEAPELRTRHNDMAAISQLPPEILADIFVYCIPTSILQLQTDLSWLNVAQVTSRWRTVALACPSLWSSLILSRPKLIPLLLERAKNASLVVRVNLRDKGFGDSPEPILLEHAARLGTLDIDSPQCYLVPFLANLGQADAAPRLQCVRIVNAYPDPEDFPEHMMWLPRNLFRRDQVLQTRKPGAYPVLRLHLEWCAFPWDSGWYSHLTCLHLENIMQRPTMEELLAVIARSPALESLSLIHCSPMTYDGFSVALPRLATLTIRSNLFESWTCGWLVGFLTVPSTAMLNISSSVESQNLQDNGYLEQAIYQALIPAFVRIASDAYDTVDIFHDDGIWLSLKHSTRPEWTRILDIFAPTEMWTPVLEVRTTECLRDRLNLCNVTVLHLRASMKTPKADPLHNTTLFLWDGLGRAMPRLHTLFLYGEFPNAWLEFMLTQSMLLIGVSHFASCFNRLRSEDFPLPFRAPNGGLTHAWPALQRLTLNGVCMNAKYNPMHLAPSSAELLRALLWARRQGGATIPQLEILECTNVDAEDVSRLRVLAEVLWDGKGITTSVVRTPVTAGDEIEGESKAKDVKTKGRGKDDNEYEDEDDEDEDDDEDEEDWSNEDEGEKEDEDEETDRGTGEEGMDDSLDAYSVNVFVNMIKHSSRY